MLRFTVLFALAVGAFGDGIGIGSPLIGGLSHGGIGVNRGVIVGNSLGWSTPNVGIGWGTSNVGHGWSGSNVGLGWGATNVGLGWGASNIGHGWGAPNVGLGWSAPSVSLGWGVPSVGMGKSALISPSLGISSIGLNRGVLVGNGLGIGGIGLAGKGLSWGAGPIGISSWGQGGIRHRREVPAQEATHQEADQEADNEPAASAIGSIGGIGAYGVNSAGLIGVPTAGIVGVPAIGVQQSVWGPSSLASRAIVAPSWGSAGVIGAKGIGGLNGIGLARPWGLGSGVGLNSPWGLGAVNAVPVAVGVRPVSVAVPVSMPVLSQQIIGVASPSVLGVSSLIGAGKHGY